ncbi:MAG: restriction endonuclease subunit S [Bacteroidota bacterium]|nr:restriction endonuclease subunit S [Bacteroidota bacterium]
MSKFTTNKLEEIADVQTGPFGSQLHMSDYKKEGTPIITVEHLDENRIIHKNLPLVGDEDKNRLKKYTLKEGDIVFSRVGSVDRCAYVSAKEDDWMFSGRLLRVRTNEKVDSRFLSFYFNQESFKEYIRRIAVGATMPSINTTILSEVEIILPPLKEQKTIAETLSSLDEKIDLLHRQKKNLQALAEILFRQWFVEEAEESWELGTIGDVVSMKGGTTPSTNQPKYWDGNIHWTSPRDLSNSTSIFLFATSRKITEEGLKQISSGLLPVGTLLLSSRAPIGYLALTEIPVAINQGYIAIICDKLVSNHFMFLWCKANMGTIENAANGSVFQEISKSAFRTLPFLIPPNEKVNKFELEIEPIFQKIKSNTQQIHTLTRLRNTILPKLISGEATIKDI